MKFLAIAAALPTVLATVATRTTPDIAGLTKVIAEAVPSMYYCQLSAKIYKHPELGGSNGISSWDSGCNYFETIHVPPIQKVLDASIVTASAESLAGLAAIESNLTTLLGHFDDFATNAKGRDEDLRFVACQFITGDTQPNGEKAGPRPNLGEPTALMLKTLAQQLQRAGQLPDLAKKAADYSAKIDALIKLIRPTCGKGASSSSTTALTFITSATSSKPYPTGTGVIIPAPSGVNGTGPAPTQPSQPGQPGQSGGSGGAPVPTAQIPGGVPAGAATFAPSVLMAVLTAGAFLLL